MSFASFEQVLAATLSGDEDARTTAEKVLDDMLKTRPDELAQNLLQTMVSGSASELRQSAAVLFRRYAIHKTNPNLSFWLKCSAQTREAIKSKLMEAVKVPQEKIVRHHVCDCISGLVKGIIANILKETDSATIPTPQTFWPGFLEELWQWTQGPDELFESALRIFETVPTLFGANASSFAKSIYDMLNTALHHQNFDIQVAASGAFVSFLAVMGKDMRKNFSSLTPIVLQLVHKALSAGNIEAGTTVLSALIDIAEEMPKFLRPHLADVIDTSLQIASADQLDEKCRINAIELCVAVSEHAPGMVRKVPQFGEKIIPVLAKFLTVLEDDDEWTTEDAVITEDDKGELPLAAEEALDRLSLALGGKLIIQPCFSVSSAMLTSGNWKERHAGCFVLSAVAEGSAKYVKPHLHEIVPQIIKLCEDPVPRVRFAAANCLGQLAADFAPESNKDAKTCFQAQFHASVLPAFLGILVNNNQHPRVQGHTVAALINFIEYSSKNIVTQYSDQLLTVIGGLLQSPFIIVQEATIMGLAAIAERISVYFRKYYGSFMPHLKNILRSASKAEHKMLRAKTFDCATLIGLSVGREVFQNDVMEIIQIMSQTVNLEPDDPQITYIHASWARVCQVLKQDFLPYFQNIFPGLATSALVKVSMKTLKGSELEDPNYERYMLDDQAIGIKTSILEEKRVACEMLIIYAQQLGAHFAPFADQIGKELIELISFFFEEGVRAAAARIQPHIIKSYLLAPPPYGLQYAQQYWSEVFPKLLDNIRSESELNIITEQLFAVRDCMKVLGVNGINDAFLGSLTDTLKEILSDYNERCRLRHEYRTQDEDFDAEQEEGLKEEEIYESEALRELSEVMHTVFGYAKDAFLPHFEHLIPIYQQLMQPGRHWQDMQWSLCAFDDIIHFCPQSSVKYAELFAQPMVDNCLHPQPEVRQAATYGIGVLAEAQVPQYAQVCKAAIPNLLKVIKAPNSREQPNAEPTENAISAFVRIGRNPENGVNENELITAVCSWIPLVEDEEEATYVYTFLCDLLERQHPVVMMPDNLFAIGRAFAVVTGELIELDKPLGQRMAGILQTMMTNPDLQQKLIQFFQTDEALNNRMTVVLTGGISNA